MVSFVHMLLSVIRTQEVLDSEILHGLGSPVDTPAPEPPIRTFLGLFPVALGFLDADHVILSVGESLTEFPQGRLGFPLGV